MSNCIRCSREIESNRNAKYCSIGCRQQDYADKRRVLNGDRSHLPTGTIGAMHELAVSVDLMRKGYLVFRSLSPSCPVDIVVLHGAKVLRIEVTTGIRGLNMVLIYPPHTKNKEFYDVIAVVERNGCITYLPELPYTEPVSKKPRKIKQFPVPFEAVPFYNIRPSPEL